jgi:hypothetical protein
MTENRVKVGDEFYPPKGIPFVMGDHLDLVSHLNNTRLRIEEITSNDIVVCIIQSDNVFVGKFQFFLDDIKDHIIREPERLPAPKQGPPAPMKEKPEEGEVFWSVTVGLSPNYIEPMKCQWTNIYPLNNARFNARFNAGLCWKTEVEAQAFCDWLSDAMKTGEERKECPNCGSNEIYYEKI